MFEIIKPILLITSLTTLLTAVERPLLIKSCPNQPDIPPIESMHNQRIISEGVGSKMFFKVSPHTKKVWVEEEIKRSRFEEDIQTLQEIAKNLIFSVAPKNRRKEQCVEYIQSVKRAYVTLKTLNHDDTNGSISVYQFVAEPEDHFYLSANMLISTIRELHYDDEEKKFFEKEQPSSFYFGLNYKVGDLYTQYPLEEFYNNLSFKAMAKFSEKPNESMGIGIGYHFNEHIELFVAKIWTNDHKSVQRANLGHTDSTTYGISFNLTKALDWVSGGEY